MLMSYEDEVAEPSASVQCGGCVWDKKQCVLKVYYRNRVLRGSCGLLLINVSVGNSAS